MRYKPRNVRRIYNHPEKMVDWIESPRLFFAVVEECEYSGQWQQTADVVRDNFIQSYLLEKIKRRISDRFALISTQTLSRVGPQKVRGQIRLIGEFRVDTRLYVGP
jgi:hypothetical protein